MAKRGRKPKTNLLSGRPSPPADLTPEAKAIFESVVDDLDSQQTLVSTDTKLIALYAKTEALTIRLEADLAKDTTTKVSDKYGATSANPLIERVFSGYKLCQLLLTKLGLTPSTRKKSSGSTDPEDAAWEL
jgi:P27 family predicted phage terminase small subunit